MTCVDFYFDCSSPGTYLAFHRLQLLQRELRFEIAWRPIFIGGIFKAVNPGVFETRATMPDVKAAYFTKDFADWARFTGIKIHWPQPFHPVNSIKAMRGCVVAARHGQLVEVARATFEAFWHDGRDISDDAVLADVCAAAGFDRETYFREIALPAAREELRRNGDELIARGGFGTPTLFVNGDDMYWGNDRLELVRAAIARANAAGSPAQ
ncbi:MAG: 2-hydroxychromene-2-carboxylate isomerase [Steroidobacteraceae bacterium]